MEQLGLYHNDIKPANMMVKEVGETRLLQLIDVDSMSDKIRKWGDPDAACTQWYSPAFILGRKRKLLIKNDKFDHALDIY